ncbi:MAG TPA: succinylglutamate desuccinylase/aspartoacylase family protein [Telluria sp.]|nr:succinylglutamate desuccinylase/aspartoacylase family protein [Telluria sp.]
MRIERHPISSACQLISLHFGGQGGGTKVYIQAALHADEVPGMLVAQFLRRRLEQLESEGALKGEVVLVPAANPLGLAQALHGTPFGRFDLSTGINFNRAFRHVADELKHSLAGRLGTQVEANVGLVRSHARDAVAAWEVRNDAEALKKTLLALAIDADIVLDLHCDNEAVLHLYAGTPLLEQVRPLANLLGARAVLLALAAGEEPFDEACSRLWWDLAAHFGPDIPIPPACTAVTVELRGEMDVGYEPAQRDAEAILQYLAWRDVLDIPRAPLPAPQCAATPLEGVEPVAAPHAGVVVFLKDLGAAVDAGETLADLIDPVSGTVTPLRASRPGVLFARTAHRHLLRGMQVCKLAGRSAWRSGSLLSQ